MGLVARIAALLFLHGPKVPAAFLAALDDQNEDLVAVASSFLECGAAGGGDASELQQELVHFSRIVDVGAAGFHSPEAAAALSRLQSSTRLPEPLKVLSELAIVMRSRLLQRGAGLEVPVLRAGRGEVVDLPESVAAGFAAVSEYVVFVRSDKRRHRRQICWLVSALLAYVTPVEAALATWAYQIAVGQPPASLTLVTLLPGSDQARLVTWSTEPERGVRDGAGLQLPVLQAMPRAGVGALLEVAGVPVTVTVLDGAARIEAGGRVVVLTDLAPVAAVDVDAMRQAVRNGMAAISGPVRSMECGHVHLDRALDVDQDLGITLGLTAYAALADRQQAPPLLTPMLDDDHVLVRLKPQDYTGYLDKRMPGLPQYLILESSPIIRSIVVVLYQRLRKIAAHRVRERGGNLFVQISNGTFCEVFEDVAGTTATGCVFFETALLTYRSAPELFNAHFRDRYSLDADVHDAACTILDGDEDHDAKVSNLETFYRQFADVTNPCRPDERITSLVEEVLDVRAPIVHLNVLEDYYEVQQHKVRNMVALLELPLQLVTVHFNARTGRIVVDV